jgi:hypothetical protein
MGAFTAAASQQARVLLTLGSSLVAKTYSPGSWQSWSLMPTPPRPDVRNTLTMPADQKQTVNASQCG